MALLKNGSTRWKNALSTGLTEIDRSVTKLVRDLAECKDRYHYPEPEASDDI